MKNPFSRAQGAVLCVALGLLAGGCDSVSLPSMSMPNSKPVQTRTLPFEPDVIYAASRSALEAMNYTFVRGSRTSGKLEMASRVLPGSALLVRQRQVKLTVVELDNGDTELQVTIWESSEDESPGGTVTATNRQVRDEAAYDVFWSRLDDQLKMLPNAGPASP